MTQHLENNWPCLFCRTVCAQMNQDKPFFTEMCISMVEIFLFFKHLSPEEPTSMSFKTPLQFSLKREELHVSVENSSSICQDKARLVTLSPCAMVKCECWSLAAVADWSTYTQLDTQHCSAQGSQTVTTCTVTKRETPNQFLQLFYYQIYLPGNYSNWTSFSDLKSLALPTPPGSGWQSAFKNIQHLHLKNFTVMLHPSSSVSDS